MWARPDCFSVTNSTKILSALRSRGLGPTERKVDVRTAGVRNICKTKLRHARILRFGRGRSIADAGLEFGTYIRCTGRHDRSMAFLRDYGVAGRNLDLFKSRLVRHHQRLQSALEALEVQL